MTDKQKTKQALDKAFNEYTEYLRNHGFPKIIPNYNAFVARALSEVPSSQAADVVNFANALRQDNT